VYTLRASVAIERKSEAGLLREVQIPILGSTEEKITRHVSAETPTQR
jgi:hypothetical protein